MANSPLIGDMVETKRQRIDAFEDLDDEIFNGDQVVQVDALFLSAPVERNMADALSPAVHDDFGYAVDIGSTPHVFRTHLSPVGLDSIHVYASQFSMFLVTCEPFLPLSTFPSELYFMSNI
jgi:hypothetical protein